MKRTALLALVLTGSAVADSRLGGPSAGFLFDSDSGFVRRISGVPGSASLDSPLPLDGLHVLAVSSLSRYALAADSDGGLWIAGFADSGRTALGNGRAAADRAVLSANGSSALLVWNGSNHVQVVSGLPSAPEVRFEADLAFAPSAVAIADDASLVLFSAKQDDGEAVYALTSGSEAAMVQRASRVAALAIASDGAAGFFADDSAIYRVRNGSVDKLADAAGVNALYASSAAMLAGYSGKVTRTALETQETAEIPCGCIVTQLTPLARGVFELSAAKDEPAWILDTNGTEAKAYFVPQAGGNNE